MRRKKAVSSQISQELIQAILIAKVKSANCFMSRTKTSRFVKITVLKWHAVLKNITTVKTYSSKANWFKGIRLIRICRSTSTQLFWRNKIWKIFNCFNGVKRTVEVMFHSSNSSFRIIKGQIVHRKIKLIQTFRKVTQYLVNLCSEIWF